MNPTSDPCIMTVTGKTFYYTKLGENEYDIEDIAHALSMITRYGGHSSKFLSVAEHSILVSYQCPTYPLTGLLHDAAEAYIGDRPRPLKRVLPDFKDLETRLEEYLFLQLGITYPFPDEVKQADLSVMLAEVYQLMPRGLWDDDYWTGRKGITAAKVHITCMTPPVAEKAFLWRYEELLSGGK